MLFCRIVEDYAVAYFGSACFKMFRLIAVGGFIVHTFACVFYRVKLQAEPSAIIDFYQSRDVEMHVSSLQHIC
jgi:hypothetical protein